MESEQKQKVNFRCAIVCGAPINNLSWFSDRISDYDFIIAADSGFDHLKKIGIKPNILIGDLDSIESVPKDIEIIKYPSKKDVTDFAICLEYCLENNILEVDVYGAWGNRAGHSIAAVFTMLQYNKTGINIRIITEKTQMFIVSDKCILSRNNGYVSIFPLGGAAEGVTLSGFEYPLDDYTLENCSPLGVSNSIVLEKGEISLRKGSLLVIIENQ